MKRIVFGLLLIGIALCAGCTTSSAPAAVTTPAASAVPDLAGNWTGSYDSYMDTAGFQASHEPLTMTVVKQQGRLFTGYISFSGNGTLVTKEIAGAISRDGKNFEMIESPDGFSDGVIISADEIELIFRDANGPTRIAIDTFRRSA